MLLTYPVEIYPFTLRGCGLSLTYIPASTGLIMGNQVNLIALKAIEWEYYTFLLLPPCWILWCHQRPIAGD